MSYSRWSDSYWYTYANVSEGNPLTICPGVGDMLDLSKDDVEGILSSGRPSAWVRTHFSCSRDQADELVVIMKEYLDDFNYPRPIGLGKEV